MITIADMKAADWFEDHVAKDVSRHEEWYWFQTEDGCGFSIESSHFEAKEIVPKPGDKLRLYSRGLGSTFHGLDVNGVEVYWLTPKERAAKHAAWVAKYDRKNREEYASKFEENTTKIMALPAPLRDRMLRFRESDNTDDTYSGEEYELFCCTEAAWLVGYIRDQFTAEDGSVSLTPTDSECEAALNEFRDLDPKEQVARGMSEWHSGGTFGGMCQLAYAVLTGVEV